MFGKICNKNLINYHDFSIEDYAYKKLYDLMNLMMIIFQI